MTQFDLFFSFFFFYLVPTTPSGDCWNDDVNDGGKNNNSIGRSAEIRARDDEDWAFERSALSRRRSALSLLQQSVQSVNPWQQSAQNSLRRYFFRPPPYLCVVVVVVVWISKKKKILAISFMSDYFCFTTNCYLSGRVRGRDGSRESINPPYINLPSPNVQDDVNISIGCLHF